MTKDVISLSISVLLLFRHYISHKITFGAPSSGGVLRSACGAFIQNILSGTTSECQTAWIQTRPYNSVGPSLGPNFCKSYQQMTNFTANRQRVNGNEQFFLNHIQILMHLIHG